MPCLALAILLFLCFYLFCLWRYPYRSPSYPPVLCYHKVSKRFCFEGTWTTPRLFFDQMDYLLDRGYRFLSEEQFLAAIDDHPSARDRSVLLTFDDGYCELVELLLPGLEERGLPFLVFLVAGYAGALNEWDLSFGRRPFRHLSWSEAGALAAAGGNLGSHGLSHRDLTRLPADELTREVRLSKEVIEDRTGAVVRSFSYPFGRFDERAKGEVEKAGYRLAFSLYPPRSRVEVDRFALGRSGVYIIDPPIALGWKLERGLLFSLEEAKGRAINRVSYLTPALKSLWSHRGR